MGLDEQLKALALHHGVDYFGVAGLTSAYNAILEQGGGSISEYPRAISIGIALPHSIVNQLPSRAERAVAMLYRHHAYDVINERLDIVTSRLTSILQQAGHGVFPVPATKTTDPDRLCGIFSHKLAAHLVLHYGPVPPFIPATLDFHVWGEIEEEKRWTWDEFNQLPRSKIQMDIHCVTRWSKIDTVWEGVSVRTRVSEGLIKIKPEATQAMQHAEYGFTVNVPLEVVMQDNFLMATHLNGEAITPDHGYPLRGVVGFIPGREDLITPYFWKGAKWLRALEFMQGDRRGFWEQAGYHNRADVWKEERFG